MHPALQDAGWTVSDVPDDYRVEKPSQVLDPCPSLPGPVWVSSRREATSAGLSLEFLKPRSLNLSPPLQKLQNQENASA